MTNHPPLDTPATGPTGAPAGTHAGAPASSPSGATRDGADDGMGNVVGKVTIRDILATGPAPEAETLYALLPGVLMPVQKVYGLLRGLDGRGELAGSVLLRAQAPHAYRLTARTSADAGADSWDVTVARVDLCVACAAPATRTCEHETWLSVCAETLCDSCHHTGAAGGAAHTSRTLPADPAPARRIEGENKS